MSDKMLGILGIGVGIAGLYFAARTAEKMDKAVNDLSKNIDIDVSDSIVGKAVEKAVDRAAGEAVSRESRNAVERIKADIHAEVKKAVDAAYSDLKGDVAKEMDRQVANVDLKKIADEITDKATEKVMARIDDDLDDILDKYNSHLEKVTKVYSSITDTLSKFNRDKELSFRLS